MTTLPPTYRLRVWWTLRPLAWFLLALAPVACGSAEGPSQPLASFGPDPVPEPVDLSAEWRRSTPAAEGFDTAALAAGFRGAADEVDNLRALLVVRRGRLVREAYFAPAHVDSAMDMRSVTKSVSAMLVGLAADRGLVRTDDFLTEWIKHESLRGDHDSIRVRHLLTMTSGMAWSDETDFGPWVRSGRPVGYVLDREVVAAPGQRFIYNTGASHLLSRIVGRAAGEPTRDFAERLLLGPLGIGNYRWGVMQDGFVAGGVGLALRARDAAKIGQLLLQGGRSGTAQILSEAWVTEQTEPAITLGLVAGVLRAGGYGFQTWHDNDGGGPGVHSFLLWGYGGQFVSIVPDRQLVVVTQAHWWGIGYEAALTQATTLARVVLRPVIDAALPVVR